MTEELQQRLDKLVARHTITCSEYSQRQGSRFFTCQAFEEDQKVYLEDVKSLMRDTYAHVMTQHLTQGDFASEVKDKKCAQGRTKDIYNMFAATYNPDMDIKLREVLGLIDQLYEERNS